MISVGILMALGFNRSSIISVITKACYCSEITNRSDLITAFKMFTGRLDVDPNLVFPPPTQRGLRGNSYKNLQGMSHRRMRGSAVSVRIVKLTACVVTAPLSIFSSKGWTKFAQKVSHLPHWLKNHLSIN